MFDIVHALDNCANTTAGPDGVSFATIKKNFHLIKYPLLVIFQQSLSQGKLPTLWKRAAIIP